MARPLAELPFPALEGLLGSLSTARFFREFWERTPAVLPARSLADRESFRRKDWRELACAARNMNSDAVEVLQTGRTSRPQSEREIDEGFSAGASVRVLRVQRAWPFLDQFCGALQWDLGFKVSANLYVTPEGRQGLDVHADSHDVIVVQMAGGKDWEIFGSPYRLPIDYRAPLVFEEGGRRDHRGDEFGGRGYKNQDVGPPLMRCSLSPGDLLYLPRGFVHKAVASRGTSVHVTIGIHSTTWGDLLALAAAQESRTEPTLRETLPPGANRVALSRDWIQSELRTRASQLLERVHGDALMLETAARFAAATSPANSSVASSDHDRFSGVAAEPAETGHHGNAQIFNPSDSYRLARDAYISVGPRAIDIRSLRTPDVVHTFPPPFRPVFDALVQGRSVSAASVAPLTERSGEILLGRLAKAGILSSSRVA